MGAPLDVLLIHEGKSHAADCPVHLLPMGFVSMADWLDRAGRRTQIWHLPIERALEPGFDLGGAVRQSGAALACFDLHWHQQSHAVIEAARAVRAACPEVRIVLGGYTASVFAEEILERFEHVDYVVCGDGEHALAALVEAVAAGQELAQVPNLTYRTAAGVERSRERQVNDAEDLRRFRFARFELVRHHRLYTQAGMMEGEWRREPSLEPGIFYCNCGRGCPYDCLFCGGARSAQRIIGGRERFVYRPAGAMLGDLRRMAEHHLDTWYNTFHPTPDESYFLDLFGRIRDEALRISMIHECLHLPSDRFLDAFWATFGPKSRLDIVLLTGADELRRRNKDNYVSTAEVLRCLERIEARGIAADLCFLTGLPFEQERDVQRSIELARTAGRRFRSVGVNAELLAIEPGSAMSRDPDRCGIVAEARTFLDYYRGHAEPQFVGYQPGAYSVARGQQLARAIRDAFAEGRRRAPASPDESSRGEPRWIHRAGADAPLVQLHDLSLWDDGWHYGLGISSLLAYLSSQPDLADALCFAHLPWRAGRSEGTDPTADEVVRVALEQEPWLVGFTLTTWSEGLFGQVARRIKQIRPETVIVAGGPVATGLGADLLGGDGAFDYVVHGYGERTFAALLRALRDEAARPEALAAIEGLHHRAGDAVHTTPPGEVLAPHEVPSPFRAGLCAPSPGQTMHVEWSRGCLANCGYCTWGNALCRFVVASRQRVLDDIAFGLERGVTEITVNSSALNFRTEHLAALCEAMAAGAAGSGLGFVGFLRYEYLDDEQLRLLRTVPFRSLIIGVQSDDPEALRAIGRPPLDRRRLAEAIAAIGAFARPAIQLITALPGDRVERFVLRLEAFLELDADVTVFPLQIPPGSPMYRDRASLGIEPTAEGEYFVFETPSLTAREHALCLDGAARRLGETRGESRRSHGVSASPRFRRLLAERCRGGRPFVELHHANVDDAGMNFGLGVPFLITHARADPAIADRYELGQRIWQVDHPDRFRASADEMVETIVEAAPEVVGFSLQPWCYERFLEVIRRVAERLPAAWIVVGGSNASIEGEALLRDHPGIDVVIAGEGERPFAELLRALAEPGSAARRQRLGRIGNLWARVDGAIVGGDPVRYEAERLDYCGDPLAAGLVYLPARGSHLNLEWTRGCPNQCTYCAWPRAQHRLRRFSAERIVADVRWARARGFRELLICDAAINYELPLLRELCQALGEGDPDRWLCFSCFVHWPLVDEDCVAAMAPVPWSRIMIGLQTDDDEGLRVLGRPAFDRPQLERCVGLLAPLGAPYVELMTGVPGDTADELRRRVEYALSLGARVSMFPLLATKGTRIHQRCVELGAEIDPRHQYVVASLPTLSRRAYRAVIEEIASLGVDPAVLEIVGYHFLDAAGLHGPPAPHVDPAAPRLDAQPPVAEPKGPSSSELSRLGSELLERLASLSERQRADHRLGPWQSAGPAEPARHADLQAVRFVFSDGRQSLAIDAFPPYQLSSPPIAQGERLAFVPAMSQPAGAEPIDQQALRTLCLALAACDR